MVNFHDRYEERFDPMPPFGAFLAPEAIWKNCVYGARAGYRHTRETPSFLH